MQKVALTVKCLGDFVSSHTFMVLDLRILAATCFVLLVGFRHELAEIAEVHTMPPRRLGYLHGLSCPFTYVELALYENELQWFVSHNIKRSVSSCQPWRAGKPLNSQRQLS